MMSSEVFGKWDRMHDFNAIHDYIKEQTKYKLPKHVTRMMAIKEYESVYKRKYRRPGLHFKW